MKNRFLNSLTQMNSLTENGAVSNSSTGNVFLDYFAKAGTYRNRELLAVFADISAMWSVDPLTTLKVIFYNRMISRKAKGFVETEQMQAGQGNKDEFRKSIIWLARYQPEVLNKNLWIVPLVGTWKDLWHDELIEELDESAVYELIEKGINCKYNADLVAKYIPRIRSKSNVFNERHTRLNVFAYGLMKYLGWTPTQYRKFKSNGKAHDFQKKLSKGLFDQIDFSQIPGKALFQLVNNRGFDRKTTFERHGIDTAYLEWIKQQPVAKFTGYAHELVDAVKSNISLAQKYTIDKQFDGLVERGRALGNINENVWCALDTSGSMTARVANTTAYDICIGLGVYFSTLNEGAFKDHVIMFDDRSKALKLGGTFTDKVNQIKTSNVAWGSTDFQSVIDEIVRIRIKNPSIPLSDYPTTLLVVSDMQFNPAVRNKDTNYQVAMNKLAAVGLPKIRIIWWWVTGRAADFPSTIEDEGTILLGGFDGTVLSLILNEEVETNDSDSKMSDVESTSERAMTKALGQEVLELLQV